MIIVKYVFCYFGPLIQLKKALEDLTKILAEKEELSQRCQELDIQVHFIHTCRNIHSYVYSCPDAASSALFAQINGLDAV